MNNLVHTPKRQKNKLLSFIDIQINLSWQSIRFTNTILT